MRYAAIMEAPGNGEKLEEWRGLTNLLKEPLVSRLLEPEEADARCGLLRARRIHAPATLPAEADFERGLRWDKTRCPHAFILDRVHSVVQGADLVLECDAVTFEVLTHQLMEAYAGVRQSEGNLNQAGKSVKDEIDAS